MNTNEINKLYLISYLIDNTNDDRVTGYSELAARLEYLKKEIERDGKLDDKYKDKLRGLTVVDEDGSLDWSELKDLINRADNDDHGQMFLEIRSKSVGPDRWVYEFHSKAPTEILEKKIEEIVGSEDKTRFFERIKSAAQISDEEMLEEVYKP